MTMGQRIVIFIKTYEDCFIESTGQCHNRIARVRRYYILLNHHIVADALEGCGHRFRHIVIQKESHVP